MERRESIGAARSGWNDRVPDFRNPRAAIFLRRQPLALQQGVGVMVPLAVREIVPEHGGRGLGFVGYPQAEIGLDQTIKRFLRMPRRLVKLKHVANAIDGGGVIAAVALE